jgi:O-antigen ligase
MFRARFANDGSERPLLAWSAGLCLVAAAFGGASAAAPLRLAMVELCALPVLALVLLAPSQDRRIDWSVGLLALIAAAPLLQLVPTPPAIWSRLASGTARAEAIALAGAAPRWAPLSLFPEATLGCAIALVPPAALFLATSQMATKERRALCALWVAVASAELVLGLLQLAQPDGGWAYPYGDSNFGSLVGLFANRNHQAAWLLALIPMSAALAAPGLRDSSGMGRLGAGVMPGLFALVALVALGAVRSRAGVLLAAPAALGALAVLTAEGVARRTLAIVAFTVMAVGVAVTLFAAGPLLDRFAAQARPEARADTWPAVVAAAQGAMPLGTGLGSFDRAFRAAEPLDLLGPVFLNHAHNDYLEAWLETGVIGIGLLALFLVWFGQRALRSWSAGGSSLARASSLAAALLLAASAVDYPLRTETLACLFAFACGSLTPPRPTPAPAP